MANFVFTVEVVLKIRFNIIFNKFSAISNLDLVLIVSSYADFYTAVPLNASVNIYLNHFSETKSYLLRTSR